LAKYLADPDPLRFNLRTPKPLFANFLDILLKPNRLVEPPKPCVTITKPLSDFKFSGNSKNLKDNHIQIF